MAEINALSAHREAKAITPRPVPIIPAASVVLSLIYLIPNSWPASVRWSPRHLRLFQRLRALKFRPWFLRRTGWVTAGGSNSWGAETGEREPAEPLSPPAHAARTLSPAP